MGGVLCMIMLGRVLPAFRVLVRPVDVDACSVVILFK